jgi:hypothetical protein
VLDALLAQTRHQVATDETTRSRHQHARHRMTLPDPRLPNVMGERTRGGHLVVGRHVAHGG